MDWKDLGQRVAALGLPILGAHLGGPLGAQVGRQVAQTLGADADPEIVAQAIAGRDDALDLLGAAQAEIIAAEGEREARLVDLYTRDVQHARETHRGHWMPAVLTLALVVMFAALTAALFFFEIPAANQRAADIVLGAMLGAFGTAIAYWLGSSRGSAEKQEILARRS